MNYLLGGTDLDYVGHMACTRKARLGVGKDREREREDMDALGRTKDGVGVQDEIWIVRPTWSGLCLTDMSHRLNGTELSREEFEENICLWYGLPPLNLPSAYDGCGKNFTV